MPLSNDEMSPEIYWRIEYLQRECTVTESPIFFKLCGIKVPPCTKKKTKAYDPLFRNTRVNRDNTREKIFEIHTVPYLEGPRSS